MFFRHTVGRKGISPPWQYVGNPGRVGGEKKPLQTVVLGDLSVENFNNKNNSWLNYPHTTSKSLCVLFNFSEIQQDALLCIKSTYLYQIVICKRRKLTCKNEMLFFFFLTKPFFFWHPFIHVFLLEANFKHEASNSLPSGCSICLTDLKAVVELHCYNFPSRQVGSLCHCFSPRSQIIPFLLQYF